MKEVNLKEKYENNFLAVCCAVSTSAKSMAMSVIDLSDESIDERIISICHAMERRRSDLKEEFYECCDVMAHNDFNIFVIYDYYNDALLEIEKAEHDSVLFLCRRYADKELKDALGMLWE